MSRPDGEPPDWLRDEQFGPCLTGHRMANGRFSVPLHRLILPPGSYPDPPSESYILTLIVQGGGPLEADFGEGRRRRDAGPGMISVLPTRTACNFVLHGSVEALALELPSALVESFEHAAWGRPVGDLGACHDGFRDPLVEAICLRLWDEAEAGPASDPLLLDSALHTLVAALLGRSGRVIDSPGRRNRLAGGPLRAVLDHMESRLDGPVSLSDLANVAHLSEFHFARLFKQATGLAPHQYLIRLRVERAKRLIRERRLSLAQIAAACGFTDQSQLTKHFRRIVGMTPRRFG